MCGRFHSAQEFAPHLEMPWSGGRHCCLCALLMRSWHGRLPLLRTLLRLLLWLLLLPLI